MEETIQRIKGQTNNDLQISDLHFDKFPTPATSCLLEDQVQDRGMYLFTISYGSDEWIKEVELVDSVDELRSLLSTRCISNVKFSSS